MPVHQPFWCEENIWHLADDATVGDGDRQVVVITGADHHVACWQQRAAEPGEPVLWDYHVVLAVAAASGWQVWDLDTRLACPGPALTWLRSTFPHLAALRTGFRPRFLLIPATEYRRDFRADRAHMRRADGGWQQPPPPWPAPSGSGALSLDACRQRAAAGLTLAELRERWGLPTGDDAGG